MLTDWLFSHLFPSRKERLDSLASLNIIYTEAAQTLQSTITSLMSTSKHSQAQLDVAVDLLSLYEEVHTMLAALEPFHSKEAILLRKSLIAYRPTLPQRDPSRTRIDDTSYCRSLLAERDKLDAFATAITTLETESRRSTRSARRPRGEQKSDAL